MRSLKSGLLTFFAASSFGILAVVGCSASGSSGVTDETSPTEPPADEPGNTLQPSQGKGDDDTTPPKDAGKDSGKKDGGSDAAKDAGPPPPTPGTACTTVNDIKSKQCGKCGTQETACIDDGSGPKWTEYGACTGEAGSCTPGEVAEVACGNCGKQTKTCTQYCEYTISACAGEPANSCVPGTVTYTSAGCGAGTYRSQTCSAACTQGNLSATCAEPQNANKLTLGTSVNSIVSGQYVLSASQKGKRPSTCGSSLASGTDYPWVAVEFKNPNATTATVSFYTQALTPGGTPQLDTVMWVYNNALPPMDDAALMACNTTYGVKDSCTSNLCVNTAAGGSSLDWSGMDGVTIPAGGKVLMYVAGYSSTETGDMKLFAKITAL